MALDTDKTNVLIALYREIFAEIRRYRDMEWKILSWTISLLAGIVAATRTADLLDAHKPYIQTLLCVFTLTAAIYGGWHIHYAHKRLTWYRQIRRKCDRVFKFFDDNVYDSSSILPPGWKQDEADIGYAEGTRHLISWWLLIALTTIYAIYSILFT